MGQRVRMNLRAFILRLREDWIYCGGGYIIIFDSLIFQSCHFCSRFFWVAILKSERFFSSINRWSGKWWGSSIDVLHEAFKIAHTYTFFDEKFLWIRDSFCIMILGFSPCFICALCRAKILLQIYTRIIASLKPPPIYTRIICEKISPRYIWKLRCV